MVENARGGEAEFDVPRGFPEKPEPTQLRNEAQLKCVSLHSELDYEVTWRAVKGQDKRPLRDALDSSPSHQWRFMHFGKEAATSALTFTTFS
jgi:hypothetical protein